MSEVKSAHWSPTELFLGVISLADVIATEPKCPEIYDDPPDDTLFELVTPE